MNKRYPKFTLLASVLVTVATVVALVLFFKIIENKNEHASKAMLTLADKMANQENAENLKSKFSEFEIIKDQTNEYFVDQARVDYFVDYLEKIGEINGAKLVVKNVELSQKDKNIMTVSLTASGSFNEVMKTIYLLENSPYQVYLTQAFVNKQTKIVQVEANKVTKEEAVSYWQADIAFNVLILSKNNE